MKIKLLNLPWSVEALSQDHKGHVHLSNQEEEKRKHSQSFVISTKYSFVLEKRSCAQLTKESNQAYQASYIKNIGWLAHLIGRFACNTRVIVDASSYPPVSCLKLL